MRIGNKDHSKKLCEVLMILTLDTIGGRERKCY